MGGFLTWLTYAKSAIVQPQEFFTELDVDGYGIPLTFVALSVSFVTFLGAGVEIVKQPAILSMSADVVLLALTAGVISVIGVGTVLVLATLSHLVVAVRSDGSHQQTVTAHAYSTGIIAFLGWMPIIRWPAALYMIYLQFCGLRQLHDLSRNTATAAAMLPYLLFGTIGGALFLYQPALLDQFIAIPHQAAFRLLLLLV